MNRNFCGIRKIILLVNIAVMMMFTSCSGPSVGAGVTKPPVQDMRMDLLGTLISVSIYDDADAGSSRRVFDEAFDIVADIDARMSVNNPDSEISNIGRAGGKNAVAVSEDTYELIERAIGFSELYGGVFDITVGAVMELWKTDEVFNVRPDDEEIKNRLPLINYKDVFLTDEGGVMLKKEGMKLDLGSIAKGYACDKVLEYLKSQDIAAALLDFGGNIYVYGSKPDGSQWKVGIRAPIAGENEVVCTATVSDVSVVTSGGYERYFEEGGVVYHHLLDPETGYPAKNGLLSVSIVDASSTRADALSTACFVLGLEEGYKLLESLPESEGIFITDDNNVYVTTELFDKVDLLDKRFKIVENPL